MSFSDLQAFVSVVNAVESLAELEAALADVTRTLGFEHYALMHHVPARAARKPILRLTNYPLEWQERFTARAYVTDDPIFVACQTRVLSFLWSDVPRLIALSPRQAAIFEEATRYGLRNGVSVPIHVPGEIPGSYTLAVSHGAEIETAKVPLVHYVGCFAFEAGRRLLSVRPNAGAVVLTPRQIDCLLLIARGKSDWEASRILGISETTVHQHVEAAKARYGVSTRMQLVVRALFDSTLAFSDIA